MMKIALLGDIAFFGKYSIINNSNIYTYFADIAKILKKYDLVIGNFETPFYSPNAKPYGHKSAHICCDKSNIELLKYLNITAVNLANNHIFDYGYESYEYTKKILNDNNIVYFGIDNQQKKIDFDLNHIILNGFCCYSTNPQGLYSTNRSGINELNVPHIQKILEQNNNNGFLSIFSIHYGLEHVNYPSYEHIKLARFLADCGSPYIFYGHHPHVIQGIEKYKGSIIAYSLGNFCFDDVYTSKSKQPLIKQSENNKESFFLEIDIDNNKIINYKIHPIYLGDSKLYLDHIEIVEKLNKYSNRLKNIDSKYVLYRKNLINKYINERKQKRNFEWYIKRININSIYQIYNAKENSIKYQHKIKKYFEYE